MYKQQRGTVLIMALLFLIIMTLLGTSHIRTATLEEKISLNLIEANHSFQSAESGLRDAEKWLVNQNSKPLAVATCTSAPCDVWQINVLPNLATQSNAWWQSNGRIFSSSLSTVMPPYHVISEYYFIPDDLNPDTQVSGAGLHYYTVTAAGTGGNESAQSVVQSVFATRFN